MNESGVKDHNPNADPIVKYQYFNITIKNYLKTTY